MAKRFTATEKWSDPWFRKLSNNYKVFWFYLLDSCDTAGIWNADFDLASYQVGFKVSENEVIEVFGDRIQRVSEGYLFIPKFLDFQYGNLTEACKPHKKVIDTLKRHGLWDRVSKGYLKGINTLQDKDKEKDKDFSLERHGKPFFAEPKEPKRIVPTVENLRKAGML